MSQLLAGVALAVAAALTVVVSGLVGPEVLGVALLGLAVGGALALVPAATPARRAGAFALGLLAAWAGYLLRAVALPDATSGRTVAVVAVVALCVVVAVASGGRLPLWAALLGAGAMAGAYETAYAANPTAFLSTSPAQATAVLVAAGLGFVAAALVAPGHEATDGDADDDAGPRRRRERTEKQVSPTPVPAAAAPEPARSAATTSAVVHPFPRAGEPSARMSAPLVSRPFELFPEA
ncbi:hypothetical protein Q9R32_00220 [Actinotalea sp. AC32]|nr:hypothetical protein [Actinotalea sp. AC32]